MAGISGNSNDQASGPFLNREVFARHPSKSNAAILELAFTSGLSQYNNVPTIKTVVSIRSSLPAAQVPFHFHLSPPGYDVSMAFPFSALAFLELLGFSLPFFFFDFFG